VNTTYVLTQLFTGTAVTLRINGATTDVSGTAFDVASQSFTAFTLGGWRSTVTPFFSNIAIRAFVFGTGVWGSSTYLPIETFLMADAA